MALRFALFAWVLLFLVATALAVSKPDCSHIHQVDKSKLPYPERPFTYDGKAPWSPQQVKVYRSQKVTNAVNQLLKDNVNGLSVSYVDVFEALSSEKTPQGSKCLFYIHGGTIRDVILGHVPKDIDSEFSQCDVEYVYNKCKSLWGEGACYMAGAYYSIGDRSNNPLEGVTSNFSVYSPLVTREYTPNTLVYDLQNKVIIDPSGRGVHDLCNLKIGLPVPESDWEEWATEESFPKNGLKKISRYWKLRAKSFEPSSSNVTNFLFGRLRNNTLWEQKLSLSFRKEYCKMINGSVENKSFCLINGPLDRALLKKVQEFDFALRWDMGENWYLHHIWSEHINEFYGPNGIQLPGSWGRSFLSWFNKYLFSWRGLNHYLRG